MCGQLARRPERNIVVVGHHNVFLGMLGVTFRNCEVRTYTFDGEGRRGGSGGAGEGEEEDLCMPLSQEMPATAAPSPPFVCTPSGKATWAPLAPLVSTCDGDLSEEDKAWVSNATMLEHNVAKMELWGFPLPDRWR